MQTTRRRPPTGLDARPIKNAVPTLRLVYAPGSEPALFSLAPGTTRIGRAGEIAIDDTSASRVHAEVEWLSGETRARIIDSNSANGTHVNGVRVAGETLEDGDVIRIGDSFFVFRILIEGPEDANVPELVGVSPAMMPHTSRCCSV
jgi:pSer/pThr/pTyr-binding forkhead associated (FHA) protein